MHKLSSCPRCFERCVYFGKRGWRQCRKKGGFSTTPPPRMFHQARQTPLFFTSNTGREGIASQFFKARPLPFPLQEHNHAPFTPNNYSIV